MTIESLIKPLAPPLDTGTWIEAPKLPAVVAAGRINRCFFFPKARIYVISTLERAEAPRIDRGLEYHLAIAREGVRGQPKRAKADQLLKTLEAFGASAAEKVISEPGDPVLHFWMSIRDHQGTALGPAPAPKIILAR